MSGLPKTNINFFGKLKKAKKRSSDGTVALILKDSTQALDLVEYRQGSPIEGWTVENEGYINQALRGGTGKVIVIRIDETSEDYTVALEKLKNKRFNYMAIPGIEALKTESVVTWIKERRNADKVFKAVLPNTKANHESIINFTADEIEVGEEVFSTTQYTARIAGALTGMPYTRSATYYVLEEVTGVKEVANPDAAVNNGELILIDDGEKIKIGRGVNSLTEIRRDEKQTEDFKSIRVIEILDMIHDEIHRGFADNYIGQVPNFYDNQVLYITEINESFKELARLELLDPNMENYAAIDVEAQRNAWITSGKLEANDWDDEQVKLNSYKRNVFLDGKIRVVETMEDLDLNIEI